MDSKRCRYHSISHQLRSSLGFNDLQHNRDLTLGDQSYRLYGSITSPCSREGDASVICEVWLGYGESPPHFPTNRVKVGEYIPGTGFRFSEVQKRGESYWSPASKSWLSEPRFSARRLLIILRIRQPIERGPRDMGKLSTYYLSHEKLALWQQLWSLVQHDRLHETTGALKDPLRRRAKNIRYPGTRLSISSYMFVGLLFVLYGCVHLTACCFKFQASYERFLLAVFYYRHDLLLTSSFWVKLYGRGFETCH